MQFWEIAGGDGLGWKMAWWSRDAALGLNSAFIAFTPETSERESSGSLQSFD